MWLPQLTCADLRASTWERRAALAPSTRDSSSSLASATASLVDLWAGNSSQSTQCSSKLWWLVVPDGT